MVDTRACAATFLYWGNAAAKDSRAAFASFWVQRSRSQIVAPAPGGSEELVDVVEEGTVVLVLVEEVVDDPEVEVVDVVDDTGVVDVVVTDVVTVDDDEEEDEEGTTVPAPAMRIWCWELFAPAVATTAHACTPQLNVVAPVFTMRFSANAVGGMVPAAVVTKGRVVVGSHCGADTVPAHCRSVPTAPAGNPVPLTVTTCPSESPVDGLTVKVTLGSVPVWGVSANAGSMRADRARNTPPTPSRRHPGLSRLTKGSTGPPRHKFLYFRLPAYPSLTASRTRPACATPFVPWPARVASIGRTH